MNKAELVDAIASKTNVSKKLADAVMNALTETIVETVASGDKVILVGFGSFEQRTRSAREGRNPKTGEVLAIPSANVPRFSAGKAFKERVSQ